MKNVKDKKKGNVLISVVLPAYKCSKAISAIYQRLSKSLVKITQKYEIIFVNDGSPDNDWEIISKLCKKNKKVKGLNLSKNFGQHYAITAGLDIAKGEWVVVMDCDLQDQPEEIEKMYNEAIKGYDIVYGIRNNRQDSLFKRMSSFVFNKIFGFLLGKKIDPRIGNFSICNKKVIENFKSIRENNRSYLQFLYWLGFKSGYVELNHAKRFSGSSSYSFKKLFKFALINIVAYSNRPLLISIWIGGIMAALAFIGGAVILIKYFAFESPMPGWTSMMVGMFFIGGLVLANLGVIGLYLGKVFDETKKRPLYVVKEKINIE